MHLKVFLLKQDFILKLITKVSILPKQIFFHSAYIFNSVLFSLGYCKKQFLFTTNAKSEKRKKTSKLSLVGMDIVNEFQIGVDWVQWLGKCHV